MALLDVTSLSKDFGGLRAIDGRCASQKHKRESNRACCRSIHRFTSIFKEFPASRLSWQIQRAALNPRLATVASLPNRPPLHGAATRVQIGGSIEVKKSDGVTH